MRLFDQLGWYRYIIWNNVHCLRSLMSYKKNFSNILRILNNYSNVKNSHVINKSIQTTQKKKCRKGTIPVNIKLIKSSKLLFFKFVVTIWLDVYLIILYITVIAPNLQLWIRRAHNPWSLFHDIFNFFFYLNLGFFISCYGFWKSFQ